MNVYLAKKNGMVVHHTDKAAMRDMDGIDTPDLTVTEEEFESAGGLVRIIDGEIALGKTESEAAEEEARLRISAIDAELQSIDAKAGRPARAVSRALARGEQPDSIDVAKLDEYEGRAASLRLELNSLSTGVAG
jgi:hypothetical protein